MNTEKNARVISLLLIVVMLLTFYFVPYKKMNDKKTQLNNEINNLSSTYNVLSIDMNKKDQYLEGIEEYEDKIASIDESLPADLPQERLIHTINDIEETIGIKMPSVSFGLIETVSKLSEEKESNNINGEEQKSNNEATDNTNSDDTQQEENESISDSDNSTKKSKQETGIKRMITTTTTLDYAQLKNLMAYLYGEGISALPGGLLNNKNRVVLNNLSLASNTETGKLTASFTLTFFGLQSDGRKTDKVNLGDFDLGKDSIFLPFSEYGIKFSVPESNQSSQVSDFFIMLSPITADQTTVTMGKASGMSSSSFVYADANEFVDTTLEIFKENNAYYYKYSAGGDKYPSEGSMAFDPGNQLDLLVLSNKRNGSDDKSGANVTIINNTDLTLNIINTGDDKTLPRFKVVSATGNVSGY